MANGTSGALIRLAMRNAQSLLKTIYLRIRLDIYGFIFGEFMRSETMITENVLLIIRKNYAVLNSHFATPKHIPKFLFSIMPEQKSEEENHSQ